MAIPNGGGIRRVKKPRPFVRPSVSLGGLDDSRREWRDIPVEQVQPGDTVVDLGLIKRVEHIPHPATRHTRVTLENVFGKVLITSAGLLTKAFVRLDG